MVKQMFWALVCLFCVLAQGFALRTQLADQKTSFRQNIIDLIANMLNMLISDTSEGTNITKHMDSSYFFSKV